MGSYQLRSDDDGYCLDDRFSRQKPLRVQFDSPAFVNRLNRAGKRNELVAKAVKAEPGVEVIDCTAGLAKDAFLLAHLGCKVTLVERSPVVATLLADGLARAKQSADLAATVNRMSLVCRDAREVLVHGDREAVLYLDPMFPEKKGTAAVRGPMQHLQNFLGPDRDADELLAVALASGYRRVVLKRPSHGSWSSPVTPAHTFSNRNSRYEVFTRSA